MHGFAFGPGTAPRLFAGLLIFLAAGVALTGVLLPGPAIESYAFRGPTLVVTGNCIFRRDDPAAWSPPRGLLHLHHRD